MSAFKLVYRFDPNRKPAKNQQGPLFWVGPPEKPSQCKGSVAAPPKTPGPGVSPGQAAGEGTARPPLRSSGPYGSSVFWGALLMDQQLAFWGTNLCFGTSLTF